MKCEGFQNSRFKIVLLRVTSKKSREKVEKLTHKQPNMQTKNSKRNQKRTMKEATAREHADTSPKDGIRGYKVR